MASTNNSPQERVAASDEVRRSHLGKKLVVVAALVALGFFVAWLRFRPYLGNEGRFTDGSQAYSALSDGDLRYAVWDAPTRLPATVNGPEEEGRPTLSPDGRYLVFSVGERGLGCDLYLAEMVAGEPRDARPLAALNSAADELAPCFSDGALWFASDRLGTSGGLDLYRASYEWGRFGEPERLDGGINSTADDTDPAPVPGGRELIFASNRKSRGLLEDFQLYQARPDDAPRVSAAGEKGRAESDGAESPEGAGESGAGDSRSSDSRSSDGPTGDGPTGDRAARAAWIVEPLEALNSAYHEREPAFTADGRTLFFASNREGGRGSYDLYRSTFSRLDGHEQWLEPEALVGVNGPGAERGPSPSRDGFSLLLTVAPPSAGQAPAAKPDLFRARSLELFRSPGRPVGWIEILVLLALALLALLAWLAQRWEQLEIVYKCFLVSVCVHLLLMWYFREVYPEGETYALHDRGDRIRVRLVADSSAASQARNSERGGEVEVARAADAAEPAPAFDAQAAERPLESALAPELVPLQRARREAPELPQRADAGELSRSEASVAEARARSEQTEVRQQAERFETRSAAAPALSIAQPSVVEREARSAQGEAVRVAAGASALPATSAAPLALERAQPADASELAARPAAERLELERAPVAATRVAQGLELAQPSERFERRTGESAALTIEAGFSAEAVPRGELSPRPAATEAPDALIGRATLAPEPELPLRRGAAPQPGLDPLAGRLTVEVERGAASQLPASVSTEVRAPAESFERRAAVADAEPQLLASAPAAQAPAPRQVEELDAGARLLLERPKLELELAPSAVPLAPARRAEPEASRTPARRDFAAEREPAPPERAVALLDEAPREERPTRAPAAAAPAAEDWISELSSTAELAPRVARDTSTRGAASAPERFHASASLPDRTPEFEPMRARAEAPPLELPERISQWEHTPYQTRSGERKTHALELHGGTLETEAAVAAGLAYLARLQNKNGYWGSPKDLDEKYGHVTIGKTGLSLLAFLGAGHTQVSARTPEASEYSHVVARAIDFLLTVQNEDNGHFGYTSSYGHAVATYALAEVFALTSDARLRAPLERAIAHIQSKQLHSSDERLDGGWGYYYPDERSYDRWPRVSVSVWQVMALESAQLGGLSVDEQVFADAKTFLTRAWDAPRGAFRYSHDPARIGGDYPILPGSTPAALFALSLLGEDVAAAPYREARQFVLERAPRDYAFHGNDDFVHDAQGNLYFWYYGTLSLFRVGGKPWALWNDALKECLLPAQARDGSWKPISIYSEYAADTQRDRSYTTAMCVLTLEVYYRYFTPLLEVR